MRFRDIVIYALVGAMVLPAQQAAPAPASPAPAKGTLTVNVLDGEGKQNSIKDQTGFAPVVEIKDEAGKPVVGAEVVFQLPLAGPGAVFNGWLRSQTVRSDTNGKATVTGYGPNAEAGSFTIKVSATSGSQTGSAVIHQSNIEIGTNPAPAPAAKPAAKGKRSIPWKIVGPVAVVATIVIVAVILRD